MDKYERYLASGEKLISVFGIGKRYFILNLALALPLSFLLIGMPWFLRLFHLWHSKVYMLTNKRVIIRDGVFSIKITSAPYDKITHTVVREDFIKKLVFNVGDISIHTAGPTPIEMNLVKVEDPLKVKNLIEELTHFTK